MMTRNTCWIAAGLMALVGCNGPAEPGVEVDAPEVVTTAPEVVPAEPTESTEVTLSREEMDLIKELPEGEQAAALAQKVCPISGENLGSMGKPIQVTAEGKSAYICCAGCKEDFEADPAAALAKLKQ